MPVSVVAELARHWMPKAIYARAPEDFYRNHDWAVELQMPCIPQGPDGLEHIKQILATLPPPADPEEPKPVFFLPLTLQAAWHAC